MSDAGLSSRLLLHPLHLLSLGFGTGLVPKMPGTAGTLIGVLLYVPLHYLPWQYYLLVTLLLFVLGIWLCGKTAARLGVHDHPAIVWDEIVGYLITMLLVPYGWGWMLAGFMLFRLFDIWKPWPIRWLDKQVRGGLGIMIDDVLAAIYGLICLQIIAYLL